MFINFAINNISKNRIYIFLKINNKVKKNYQIKLIYNNHIMIL